MEPKVTRDKRSASGSPLTVPEKETKWQLRWTTEMKYHLAKQVHLQTAYMITANMIMPDKWNLVKINLIHTYSSLFANLDPESNPMSLQSLFLARLKMIAKTRRREFIRSWWRRRIFRLFHVDERYARKERI